MNNPTRGKGRARRIAIASLLLAALAPAARVMAADLMTIHGTVKDKIGRPLANVAVSDGNKVVYTNSSGAYSIGESTPGTYQITVSRLGLDPLPPRSVGITDALGSIDFVETYVLGIGFSAPAFNSSRVPTEQVSVTTYSPASSSCISWTDAASSTTVSLALASTNADGSSIWTGSFPVADLPEASYATSAVAKDCTSSTALSLVRTASYIVDNTAPTIDTGSVFPQLGGHTTFTSQPLGARVFDLGGSDIDPSSIAVTLSPAVGNATTFSGSALTYSPTTTWVKTTAASLAVNGRYSVAVNASDRAGNTASYSQGDPAAGAGFLVTTISSAASSTTARIPESACTVSSGASPKATCSNVTLHVDPASIALGPLQRAGTGGVDELVKLDNLSIRGTIAGTSLVTHPFNATSPAPTLPKVRLPFVVSAANSQPASYATEPINVTIGTITASVPPGTTAATVFMDDTATTASASNCSDPTPAAISCTPDPVGLDVAALPWSPPTTNAKHVAPCDAALSHAENVAWTPGTQRSLSVHVNTTVLKPNLVTLLYSINGQAAQTVSTAGSASTADYTLSIPGSSLADGAAVRYAFEVAGQFVGAACAGLASAVTPSNGSFVAYTTSNSTKSNAAFVASAADAMASARIQPSYLLKTGLAVTEDATLCGSPFFASPTPCALLPDESVDVPQADVQPDPNTVIPVESGGGSAFAQMAPSAALTLCDHIDIYNDDWTYADIEQTRDIHTAAKAGGSASNSVWGPPYTIQANVTSTSSVQRYGSSSSGTTVVAGVHFSIGPSGAYGDTYHYAVHIDYSANGVMLAGTRSTGGGVVGFIPLLSQVAPVGADAQAWGSISPVYRNYESTGRSFSYLDDKERHFDRAHGHTNNALPGNAGKAVTIYNQGVDFPVAFRDGEFMTFGMALKLDTTSNTEALSVGLAQGSAQIPDPQSTYGLRIEHVRLTQVYDPQHGSQRRFAC